MNKMEEVAKILGVVIDEKFDIEGSDCNPFKLTMKYGLIDCRCGAARPDILGELLVGDYYTIIKCPFKPVDGERYWYVARSDGAIAVTINDYYCDNYHRIAMGNCFRTPEEAEAAVPEIVKKMQDFFCGGVDCEKCRSAY